MKIRFWERILFALAGLLLMACGLSVFLWAIGFFPEAWFGLTLPPQEMPATVQLIVEICSVAAVLLGIYLFATLFRRGNRKKGFVLQDNPDGQLSISIKALESLVQKCIDKHEELISAHSVIECVRGGVIVKLRVSLASGVSIPLVAEALQRQIKQYINACSGVEVEEVRIQVETASGKIKETPYAIPEMFKPAALNGEVAPAIPEESVVSAAETLKAEVKDSARVEAVQEPPKSAGRVEPPITYPETDAEDDRPLHQRLFCPEQQMTTVPVPPEVAEKLKQEEQAALEAETADAADTETVAKGADAMPEAAKDEESDEVQPEQTDETVLKEEHQG